MMKKIVLIVVLISISISCSEQKIIDETRDDQQVLVATGGPDPTLKVYSYPQMEVVIPDVMQEINQEELPGEVTKIELFRRMFFLLMPEAYKILVIDNENYSKIAEIDFSSEQLKPTDIAFPNATDAYVTHPDQNFVSIVDITVFEPDEKVETGDGPVSITSFGNQIYITNLRANTISVVDSRTLSEEREIKVADAPVLGDIAFDKEDAVLISAGSGKFTTEGEKGEMHVYYINTSNSLVRFDQPLVIDGINLKEATPVSMVTTKKDWAFVATDKYLIKIDTREDSAPFFVSQRSFSKLVYDSYREIIMMIEDYQGSKYIVTIDDGSGVQINSADAPGNVTAVYPL